MMNGYNLTKEWFEYSFESKEAKPIHTALYLYLVELNNRFSWKYCFGVPTTLTMEVLGIKSYKTYSKTLIDLCDFGFIEMIEKSKNQYTSNIIALAKNDKALSKALTEAMPKHIPKQVQSINQLNVSIVKLIKLIETNETNKSDVFDIPKNPVGSLVIQETPKKAKKADSDSDSDFKKTLEEFKKMRRQIKKPMTKKAEELLLSQLTKMVGDDDELKIEMLEKSILHSWQGVFELKDNKPKKKKQDQQPFNPQCSGGKISELQR